MTSSPNPTPSRINTNRPKILIIDDDESLRSQMRWALSNDYEILEAEDRETAMAAVISEHPRVVMLDLGLPPKPREAEEGLRTLKEILSFDSSIKVVIVSGNTERENAIEAIGMGAIDFFTKPPLMEEVRVVVKRAFQVDELERENMVSRYNTNTRTEGMEGIIGQSNEMKHVFQVIRKVAKVDIPVLILGESGTGKELAARAIHRLSHRQKGPFIVINCGAIPETLLESELFGYEKGAFTGADSLRKGRIEYADGGTLFLDEIGELSLSLQVKLLRFLQEHVIERVGGRKEISVDVRVIAATNRNIVNEVENGNFRNDLFFRLGVVTCYMPPLRERDDDVYLLARTFLERYSHELGKKIKGFQVETLQSIAESPWPGNIRELENRVKRAVVMTEGDWITPLDLNLTTPVHAQKLPCNLRDARESIEKQMIFHSLQKHGGVVLKAAEELGITRQTLTHLIKKYGISTKP